MKKLEPELREIKKTHKNDSQTQAKKTMELLKKHGINPVAGILTLFIQIPIIFALYKVFLGGMTFDPVHLYSFVTAPDFVSVKFLGLVDVTQKSYIMPILAALTQFYQMKLAIPPIKNRPAKTQLQRQSGQKYECPNEVCNAIFHIFYRPEAFFRHRSLLDDHEYLCYSARNDCEKKGGKNIWRTK